MFPLIARLVTRYLAGSMTAHIATVGGTGAIVGSSPQIICPIGYHPGDAHPNAVVYGGQGHKGCPVDSQAERAASGSGAHDQEQRAVQAHVCPRKVKGQGTIIHRSHQWPTQLNQIVSMFGLGQVRSKFSFSTSQSTVSVPSIKFKFRFSVCCIKLTRFLLPVSEQQIR